MKVKKTEIPLFSEITPSKDDVNDPLKTVRVTIF